ncbi:MAG: MbnP family protein [Saprospiraceae bacterium]
MSNEFKISFGLFFLLLMGACSTEEPDAVSPIITISSPQSDAIIKDGTLLINASISDDVELKTTEVIIENLTSGITEYEQKEDRQSKSANISLSIDLDVPEGGSFLLTIIATDQSNNSTSHKINFEANPTNRGILNLNFRLEYEGETLATFSDLNYPNPNFPFLVSLVSAFLSNITIFNGTNEQEILEIERIKINENQDDKASALLGTTLSIPHVVPGDFTGIRFGVGVPAQTNSKSPVDFPQNHPLFFSGEYWDSWDSYIFFKIEGKADMDQDGTKETNLALHVGSNEAFRIKEVMSEFTVKAQETTTLQFVIDVKDIFDMNGAIYDIVEAPQIHSLSQIDQATQLADNLQQAIK